MTSWHYDNDDTDTKTMTQTKYVNEINWLKYSL